VEFHRLCVLGLGYIGLPTASTFATHGLQVTGTDVNPHVVNSLQNGQIHIHEPGLGDLVQTAIQSGSLSIRSEPEPADAFIIAVPTPFLNDKRADLRYVVSAAEAIVSHLRKNNLVVLESTSPPRTTCDIVAPILERSGLRAGRDFYLAYSPERVLPGHILRELVENARVIGGVDPTSAEAGRDLYRLFVQGEIVLTDATTAEMVKLMENTYRDVNIAIANEFSRLAERFGVDVWEAIQIANRHPRVNILKPGPGVGGHCISVDPWFFVEAAPELTHLIRAARHVNDQQPDFVLSIIQNILSRHAVQQGRLAALGLSYKPDVDDVRESPSVRVVQLLKDAGISVVTYEPYKPGATIAGVSTVSSLDEALEDADVLLLLVAHTALCRLEPAEVFKQTKARLVIDAVGGWQPELWRQAGFQFYRLGNGKPGSFC